jgi:hypothetical protein
MNVWGAAAESGRSGGPTKNTRIQKALGCTEIRFIENRWTCQASLQILRRFRDLDSRSKILREGSGEIEIGNKPSSGSFRHQRGISAAVPGSTRRRAGGGGDDGMVGLMGGESPGCRGVERYVRNDLFGRMRLGWGELRATSFICWTCVKRGWGVEYAAMHSFYRWKVCVGIRGSML